MRYEIKFKNKKQSHIYSIKITTQLSSQKKKKKIPHNKNYHTFYIIKKKNDHSNYILNLY